jgi:hypothetical protein
VFIGRTRVIDNATNQEVSRQDGMLTTAPAGTRLEYDLRCSLRVQVAGVTDDTRRYLVVRYQVWLTPASRIAGDPPALWNSHLFSKPKAGTNLGQYVKGHVLAYIERASLAGWTGDRRDPRITSRTNDPSGFYNDAGIVALRDAVFDLEPT